MATYTIDSVQDLIDLTLQSGKFNGVAYKDNLFNLTTDLDLTGVDPLADGKGWKPIGTWDTGKWFNGFFNGNGNTISNMIINRPLEDHLGLFGSFDGDADGADPSLNNPVKNLALVDIDITGDSNIGGMVGSTLGPGISNNKPVKNCSVTGVIACARIAGGFVGSSNNGYFKDCWCNVAITTTPAAGRTSAGGFVGSDTINTDCVNCYSLGAVTLVGDAGDRTYIGGLIGEIDWENGDYSSSPDCALTEGAGSKCLLTQTNKFPNVVVGTPEYARVDFNDVQYTNGLYEILASDDDHSVLIDLPFVGNVANGVEVNCQFVGANSAYATDSFWDITTSGLADDGQGFGDAEGKSTANMKKEATFTNWDFTNEWWITEDSTYPLLRVFGGAPAPSGQSELSYSRGLRGIGFGINRGVV